MTDHTKTPWRNSCFQVYGADKSKIAHTGMGQLPPSRSSESEANAVFIVKAVNNHEALVEAAQNLIDEISTRGTHERWKTLANLLHDLVGSPPVRKP